MSAVFINDHPFYYTNSGEIFTSGTLTSDVWSRFTDNFGELTVIGRGMKIGTGEINHTSSMAFNVTFDLFKDIQGGADYLIHRKRIVAKLAPYIKKSTYIILRLPSSIGVIAAELCVKYNKKYLVEVVGCAFDSLWYMGGITGKIIAPIAARRNRTAIARANAAVYVTSSYLQEKYPNFNAHINASNVVIESFENKVLEDHLERIRREEAIRLMGMIGNVSLPYKGFEVLFKALSRLSCAFRFLIVGGGSDVWIKALIKKYNLQGQVFLLGRVNSREGIYKFLDNLDLYIQPSLTEGLPRSVIEAMSRGCPIITSDAGGNPELIDKDFVYPKNSDRRLQFLIEKVIHDTPLLTNLSARNFRKSKDYTFDNINRKRYMFFNDIKSKIQNK